MNNRSIVNAAEKCPTLTNMLVIIVGGIPIAMPTVLSVTLALGAFKLARVRNDLFPLCRRLGANGKPIVILSVPFPSLSHTVRELNYIRCKFDFGSSASRYFC